MTQFGWNPLLGVPPVSLYETLEKRAAASDGCWKLEPGPGPREKRWAFRHYGDDLVHNLLALRHTKYWQHEQDYIPIEAITECGVLALMRSETGWPAAYDSGIYVPNEPLTCIRCLSGVEQEGLRYRETQKAAQFAQAYGMTPEKMSKTFGYDMKPGKLR